MNDLKNRKTRGFTLMELAVVVAIVGVMAFMGEAVAGVLEGAGDGGTEHWKAKWQYFSGTASENIAVGQALSMDRQTGEIGLADYDAGASTFVVGLAGNTASKGSSVQVVRQGILSGISIPYGANSGISPYGTGVYISDVAGSVTSWPNLTRISGMTGHVIGFALPQSQQVSGNTRGTDTIFVDIISAISPFTSPGLDATHP